MDVASERGPAPARTGYLTSRLAGYGTTVFAQMSALAEATGSINLGQGFPDTDGPAEVAQAAIEAISTGRNQYPPGRGVPELLDAISAHARRFYDLSYDPDREILVTAGATEAIASALLSLLEVGDEVVMFEPFYDSYPACVAMAGAVSRTVRLHPPDWHFDPGDLARAVTERTRLILVNTPHNPTGKVFSHHELEQIATMCVQRDLIAVTDEVYEHMVFDGRHVPLASFPGMADRTVRISSGAKTFSFTGWKVGWACGPEPLIDAVRTAKQFLTYVNAAPLQPAIAVGLRLDDAYFASVGSSLVARRDLLARGLEDLGLTVFPSAGTFFLTTDVAAIGEDDAQEFCLALPRRFGVVAIPSSVFYGDPTAGRTLVRWTFCKKREVLLEALTRLEGLGSDRRGQVATRGQRTRER